MAPRIALRYTRRTHTHTMAFFGGANHHQRQFGGNFDASSHATGYPGLGGGFSGNTPFMPASGMNARAGVPTTGYDNTVYAGALKTVIDTKLRDMVLMSPDHPLITRVAPMAYTSTLTVQRNIAAIVEQCATAAAHRTGFRKVQTSETSITRTLQRFGHGFSIDKSVFETAAGPRELRLKIIALAQAFLRAIVRATQTELLRTYDAYYESNFEFNQSPYSDTDGEGANTLDRLRAWFKTSIDTYACLSKPGSTFLAAVHNAKQMIERRNGVPDTLLVAPGVIARLTVGDERATHMWINGPNAEVVKVQGYGSLPTYAGLSVIEMKRYGADIKTSQFTRNNEVGEWYPMLRTVHNPVRFQPAFRGIELYDESTDSGRVISLAHAIEKSGVFDATGSISSHISTVADQYNSGGDDWHSRHGLVKRNDKAEIEKLHLFIYEDAPGHAAVVRSWGDIGLARLGGIAGLSAFARSAISSAVLTATDESTLRTNLALIGTLASQLSTVAAPNNAAAISHLPENVVLDTSVVSEVGTIIDAVSNDYGSVTPRDAAGRTGWGMANSAGFYNIARNPVFAGLAAFRNDAVAAVQAAETMARLMHGTLSSSALFGASATPPNIHKSFAGSSILDLLITRAIGVQVPVWGRSDAVRDAGAGVAAAAVVNANVGPEWTAVLNGLATYDAKVAERVRFLYLAIPGAQDARLLELIYAVVNERTLLGQTIVDQGAAQRTTQRLRRIFANFTANANGANELAAELQRVDENGAPVATNVLAKTLYANVTEERADIVYANAPDYNPDARANIDTRGAPAEFLRLPYTLTVSAASALNVDVFRVSDKVFQAQMIASRGAAVFLGARAQAHGVEQTHMVRNELAARMAAAETEGIGARGGLKRGRVSYAEEDEEEENRPAKYVERTFASAASAASDMRADDFAARMDIGAAFSGPYDRLATAGGAARVTQVQQQYDARAARAAAITAETVLTQIASESFREVYTAVQRLPLVESVVASALLFAPVDKNSTLILAQETDAPFGVLIFRPNICHTMGLVMAIESGPDTIQNYYNETDVEIAGDITKVYNYNATFQHLTFMHTAWHAQIVADVLPTAYRYGCDVVFADATNNMTAQYRNRNKNTAVAKPSIYACIVPINFEPVGNMLDITGVFNVRGLDNNAEMNSYYPLYPGAAVMEAQYQLDAWVTKQVFSVATDSGHNTLTFRGWHLTHSGAEAAADYSRVNNNTGHWGTVCQPGCASLRSGAMSVYAATPGAIMAS